MAKNDHFNDDEDLNPADEPTEENTRPEPEATAELSEAEREHRDAERKIFGEEPMRDQSGAPMERGLGSKYQKSNPEVRDRYHVAVARVAAEEVLRQADILKKHCETLLTRLVEAKVVPPPPSAKGP